MRKFVCQFGKTHDVFSSCVEDCITGEIKNSDDYYCDCEFKNPSLFETSGLFDKLSDCEYHKC